MRETKVDRVKNGTLHRMVRITQFNSSLDNNK